MTGQIYTDLEPRMRIAWTKSCAGFAIVLSQQLALLRLSFLSCHTGSLLLSNSPVKAWSSSKRQSGIRPMAVAGVMLALWLATFAAAACPQFHRLFHPEAQNPTHECLVTQIQKHSFTSAPAPIALPSVVRIEIEGICSAVFQFRPAFDCPVAPGRAPPSFLTS